MRPPPADEPVGLADLTVGLPGARRSAAAADLLGRYGARVVVAPAMSIRHPATDEDLVAALKPLLAEPPRFFVATTGEGMRMLFQAADALGVGDDLLSTLRRAEILARGTKAAAACRAGGLGVSWTAPSERSAEIVDHLVEAVRPGDLVAVQEHGAPLPAAEEKRLGRAGAVLVRITPYRRDPPDDPSAARRLVELVAVAGVDALLFTSAAVVAAFDDLADACGLGDVVRRRCARDVAVASGGPVCDDALADRGYRIAIRPRDSRLGLLIRSVAEQLPALATVEAPPELGPGSLRGRTARTPGGAVELDPGPALVVRRLLASYPAPVPVEVLRAETEAESVRGLRMTISRTRARLREIGWDIEAVLESGYRLTAA